MFRKVSLFVDSGLVRANEHMPGSVNQPVWQTCFNLLNLFAPVSPHGCAKGVFKDPKELLNAFCRKFHEYSTDFPMKLTPLSRAVKEASRIEVAFSLKRRPYPRDDHDDVHNRYVWELRYFLKGKKQPVATATIGLMWDGEITSVAGCHEGSPV